ncbi:MAG: sulfur carrier protein ThiS [Myxococcales bacterium]|nr:sulfur carrier protein ThiS [Myxococcales bacterium]
MRIQLNGEPRDIPEGRTLLQLLDELELAAGRVAVEHNREVIRRANLGEIALESGDVVELIHFVGGG